MIFIKFQSITCRVLKNSVKKSINSISLKVFSLKPFKKIAEKIKNKKAASPVQLQDTKIVYDEI